LRPTAATQAPPEFSYRFAYDQASDSVRLPALVDDDGKPARRQTIDVVREHLTAHPDASANEVFNAIGGTRTEVLAAVKEAKSEGWYGDATNHLVPAGTARSGQVVRSRYGRRRTARLARLLRQHHRPL